MRSRTSHYRTGHRPRKLFESCGFGAGDRGLAAWRLVNFLTGFRSWNGATPAKLFQVPASRDTGHSALSLARTSAMYRPRR
jgi:hypothetical protein